MTEKQVGYYYYYYFFERLRKNKTRSLRVSKREKMKMKMKISHDSLEENVPLISGTVTKKNTSDVCLLKNE